MQACPEADQAMAYTLQQMQPDVHRTYLAHTVGCLACQMLLTEVSETLAFMAYAAPDNPPPASLREKVLVRIAAEGHKDLQNKRRSRRTLLLWAAAGAAAIALSIGTYALLQVDRLQHQWSGFQRAAPLERSVSLTGTERAPAASGLVLITPEGKSTRVVIQARGLPPLQTGEAYQLWLIKDGTRTNGGVFIVDGLGTGSIVTWLPADVTFDAMGVTREPDAFGTQPRGQKVLGSSS
jgi:hypothetical protein